MVEYSRKVLMVIVLGVFVSAIIYAYGASIGPNDIAGFNWVNSTVGMDTPNTYIRGTNVTALSLYPQQPASYIIWRDGSTYYAKSGTTGAIDYSGNDADALIQAIIDVLSPGGCIVLKGGDYYIDRTINITKEIYFIGSGKTMTSAGTRIMLANNSDCDMFNLGGSGNHFFVVIANMRLNGNSGNQATGNGIITNASMHDCRFYNLFVSYIKQTGFYINGGHNHIIERCEIEYCGTNGIRLNGATQIKIINNFFTANNVHINNVQSDYIFILQNQGFNTLYQAIYITDAVESKYITITDNQFYDVGGLDGGSTGIDIQGTHILCKNNIIGTGATLRGIKIRDTSDYVFAEGNDLIGCAVIGIDEGVGNANGIIRCNMGHTTENSGNATLAAVSSSIVVNHGCAYTPTLGDIQVTPNRDLGNCTYYWYDTITATQFTIHVGAGGAPKNIDKTVYFLWGVDRH